MDSLIQWLGTNVVHGWNINYKTLSQHLSIRFQYCQRSKTTYLSEEDVCVSAVPPCLLSTLQHHH